MAISAVGQIRPAFGVRDPRWRGRVVVPIRPVSSLVDDIREGSPFPDVSGSGRGVSSQSLRLTDRGIAVLAALLIVQFLIAACVVVGSFLAVSDEPLRGGAAEISAAISGSVG